MERRTNRGPTQVDRETWRSMEEILESKEVGAIGISNVHLDQLIELYEFAQVKPSTVRNRCFADTRWDEQIRKFCSENKIVYQGFSLLTANRQYLGPVEVLEIPGKKVPKVAFANELNQEPTTGLRPEIASIIRELGVSIQQVVFRFAQQIGMLPMTGTTSPRNMKLNLEINQFELNSKQIEIIENIAFLS